MAYLEENVSGGIRKAKKEVKKEKKEMKANGKLEEWEEGRTWKY